VVAPHERFRQWLTDAAWQVVDAKPLYTGPNPMRVHVRRGKVDHRLLIYAWRITSEGTGRVKAGRADLDYRIQTTRSHDSPLEVLPGHVTLGLGSDQDRDIFAAFDPWMKRYTGVSSSVHFHRRLLEIREDGPEVAFRAANVERFLMWAFARERRPLFRITPDRFERAGDIARIAVDPLRERDAMALRPHDSVILIQNRRVLEDSVWVVDQIDRADKTTRSGNYNRVMLHLLCRRIGVVNDARAFEWAER
jgi:hypothetical protein